jgi:DNA-binding transcriptional ArsR family regulator
MENETNVHDLLTFFKALSDANRLKIVGLLAKKTLTVEELSSLLGIGPSTVSHHLAKLAEAGLVSARPEGYYNVYRLETEQLERMAKRLLSQETLPAVVNSLDMEQFDRKVIADYLLPDGRLRTIPAQHKKMEVILHYVVRSFEPGIHYDEKQVNEILSCYHEDTASLRRELIGSRLMARQPGGTDYWRI